MATKKSGHDRKRWRITFKLPIVHHQHTQRPMTLSTDEFSFTSYGYAAGVAVQRAWQQLRAVPELKGAIIRDCFITVKCLGYFTKADEGLARPSAKPELRTAEGDDGDMEVLCDHGVGHSIHVHTCDGCCRLAPLKDHPLMKPDDADIRVICPDCGADITENQPEDNVKHLLRECKR